jgi:hypothetical protein
LSNDAEIAPAIVDYFRRVLGFPLLITSGRLQMIAGAASAALFFIKGQAPS